MIANIATGAPEPLIPPAQIYLGGPDGGPAETVTASVLLAGAPGTNFVCDALGRMFYILDSAGDLWIWDSLSFSSTATELLSAATLGYTIRYMVLSLDGSKIYATTTANKIIAIATASPNAVTVLAGSGTAATTDGTGTAAAFNSPRGICLSGDGLRLFVDENATGNGGDWRARKIVISTGVVTEITENNGQYHWFQYANDDVPLGNLVWSTGDVIYVQMGSGVVYAAPTVQPATGLHDGGTKYLTYNYDGTAVYYPFTVDGETPAPTYFYGIRESTAGTPGTWNSLDRRSIAAVATKLAAIATTPGTFTSAGVFALAYRPAVGAIFTIDSLFNLIRFEE